MASFSVDLDRALVRNVPLEYQAWSIEMQRLLRRLQSCLGDTVGAWDKFTKKDIGYFLFDDECPATSSRLKCSVNAVDNVFLDLKDILRKLRHLEDEVKQENPQRVS
jgi:hypothetical protein